MCLFLLELNTIIEEIEERSITFTDITGRDDHTFTEFTFFADIAERE
jgi:hypothetical protein